MFNFIRINENAPQKKIFTLRNYELINHLLKDEALFTGATESSIIENLILSSYLNPADDELVYPVVNYLFDSKGGIASTCKAVFEFFVSRPSLANDSLIPLLDYLLIIESRHRTIIKGDEHALKTIMKYASIFKEQLDKYDGKFHSFNGPDNYRVHIDMFDHIIIDEMSDATSHIEDINIDGGFSTLISTLKKYWFFGGETDTAGMRNWLCVYKMLAAICELSQWPDYPQYRYELVQVIRKITISDGRKGSFDSSQPVLSKEIFIKGGRSLITTQDAVILESLSGMVSTSAENIIHGPNTTRTQVPFIITFNESERDNLKSIIKQVVQDNPQARAEFPNPQDAYGVPIYYDGSYTDKRVKWVTI